MGRCFNSGDLAATWFWIDLISEANFYDASAGSVYVNRNDHCMETESIQVSAKSVLHSSIPVASTIMYALSLR